ncbi:MAG: NADH:flavin oxidoreductase, partial [Candidatus Solibacter usitatus]|nr:NADH:flavin oxidoreductase [Candidatus Solibacter usitatus]
MKHFTYRSLDELQRAVETTGAGSVRFEADRNQVSRLLGRKVAVGGFTAGNSLAIHPMEGCDSTPDGRPDELTWRRYLRFARGGAKLLWFEATAVRHDGRANARQLWITRDNVDDYARLVEAILREHRARWGSADDLLMPVQLTHSGRYAVPVKQIAYHNPFIDRKSGTPAEFPVIGDDELERVEDAYAAAARLAVQAGFRAIDLKVTHGYLLSELTGAKTREGRYGGPLENRLRMIGNVLGKIRAEVGSGVMLCMRLGCFDGVPYGKDPQTNVGVPCDYPTPYPY